MNDDDKPEFTQEDFDAILFPKKSVAELRPDLKVGDLVGLHIRRPRTENTKADLKSPLSEAFGRVVAIDKTDVAIHVFSQHGEIGLQFVSPYSILPKVDQAELIQFLSSNNWPDELINWKPRDF